MSASSKTILFIGATGSIGVPAVSYALQQGHRVRALVRDLERARKSLPSEVELYAGDVTIPVTFENAVRDVDAVVLTVNADGSGKAASEAVYYAGVRDLLNVLHGRKVHIALMTTIGVTEREGHYNRSNEGHDWKRRAERLVRASGQSYTIVRPGWFDYNSRDQQKVIMLQGDTRRSGTPADGAISRQQIARVLVDSISIPEARAKTLELIAEKGTEQDDLSSTFSALLSDHPESLDGIRDIDNQPFASEPDRVRADLDEVTSLAASRRATSAAMADLYSAFIDPIRSMRLIGSGGWRYQDCS